MPAGAGLPSPKVTALTISSLSMAYATAWRSFGLFMKIPFLNPKRRSANATPGLAATVRARLPLVPLHVLLREGEGHVHVAPLQRRRAHRGVPDGDEVHLVHQRQPLPREPGGGRESSTV